MSRGHMTAKADFVYGAHMRATFWFMNVAPQWQTFNGGNWNNMEMSTRSFAGGYDNNLDVYTGTHGVTTLADVNGNEVPIHIAYDANNNGILRVPALYWRVVFDPTTGNVSMNLKINGYMIFIVYLFGNDFDVEENCTTKIDIFFSPAVY
jgi:DNA/RNA endonuclease G (NUC1)